MHSFCFNPAENRARVDAAQDGCLVHRHHLGLCAASRAPTKNFPGTADEQHAFRLDGDLGSFSFHVHDPFNYCYFANFPSFLRVAVSDRTEPSAIAKAESVTLKLWLVP